MNHNETHKSKTRTRTRIRTQKEKARNRSSSHVPLPIRMKPFLLIVIKFLIIFFASVIVHEWIHVFQIHYTLGIPWDQISIHFIWEIANFTQFKFYTLPAAWTSFPQCTGQNRLEFEIVAYNIQILFIITSYYFIMHRPKKHTPQSL